MIRYAHRDASAWAIPPRAAGPAVQDLHPDDRGRRAPTTARSSATAPLPPRGTAPADGTRAAGPYRHEQAGTGNADQRAGPVQPAASTADDTTVTTAAAPAVTGKNRRPLWPRRCGWTGTAWRSGTAPNIPRPAANSRRSASAGRCPPRRAETSTTVAAGALLRPPHRAEREASPPSATCCDRHRRAGAALRPLCRRRCSRRRPIARNQRIWQPGTPGRTTTSAAPPPACAENP